MIHLVENDKNNKIGRRKQGLCGRRVYHTNDFKGLPDNAFMVEELAYAKAFTEIQWKIDGQSETVEEFIIEGRETPGSWADLLNTFTKYHAKSFYAEQSKNNNKKAVRQ